MTLDRGRLMGRLRGLSRGGRDEDLARLIADIERGEARVESRRAAIPPLMYPADLPVSERRAEIAAAIEKHQVVVVCGETGSGKTTQIPKICLELGRGVRGVIGHTQPRRIAAVSVATRVAQELNVPLGGLVGYKIRFGDRTANETAVKLMTDGVLLAETQGDRRLERYDTIIIDEAHERSLNIDFLLGYLRTLLPRRPDLKVIITSATIDPERFARHFRDRDGRDAPIVMVSGRTYPVEVRYLPAESLEPEDRDAGFEPLLLRAVDEAARTDPGDMLVFLPGEREIREAAESLRKHRVPGHTATAVLPLYGKLSAADQQKVFEPHPGRRIVLATNVAETSLTVPGIRFVIDSGLARLNRYSHRTKVQRLEVEPISQASAAQRAGRCGRIGPGICFRLYAQEDFEKRPEFTEPEILRTNLASVILQMKALHLGAVEEFPFIEPPDSRMIKDGYDTLLELGAIDQAGALTKIGRDLSRLPIDPRIGRIILAADAEHCLAEGLVIAAAMSVQDPRDRPLEEQDKADAAHALLRDERSDFLSYLKLWGWWRHNKRHLSSSKLRKACKANFLSFMRMREWDEVHHQLAGLVGSMGYKARHEAARPDADPNDGPQVDVEALHRAVLAGLLSNIGMKTETGEYAGPRGVRFNIFPGSSLFKKGPKWVVAAELVRTTKLYARTVAGIKPEWIETLAGDLVRKTQAEPVWSPESGRAVALERGTLFGLEIYAKRRVDYGKYYPKEARELFIHHALVESDMRSTAAFHRHNIAMVDEVREMEVRARRTDLLASFEQRFAFFDAKIPADVYNVPRLDRWRKEAERESPRLLFLTLDDLVRPEAPPVRKEDFPDDLEVGGVRLPLVYRLTPGEANDGLTARLPVAAVTHADEDRMGWLVPGLLEQKIAEIVRALPKPIRRLVPQPTALAKEIAAAVEFGKGSLIDQIGEHIRKATGHAVPRDVLAGADLPKYLRMHYEVVADDGRTIAAGDDLEAIRRKVAPQVREALRGSAGREFNRDGLKDWDFDDLPVEVVLKRAGVEVPAYPALVDRGTSVSLRLYDTAPAAAEVTRLGLRRLYVLAAKDDYARRVKGLPVVERLLLPLSAYGRPDAMRKQLLDLMAERAFMPEGEIVRDRAAFDRGLSAGLDRLGRVSDEVGTLVERIVQASSVLDHTFPEKTPDGWGPALADIRAQKQRLMHGEFLSTTAWEHLRHYPRYLAAATARIRKLPGAGAERDARAMAQLAPHERALAEREKRCRELGVLDPALIEFRWMIEEFRVQLFAQELGTARPVSEKRLAEQLARCR